MSSGERINPKQTNNTIRSSTVCQPVERRSFQTFHHHHRRPRNCRCRRHLDRRRAHVFVAKFETCVQPNRTWFRNQFASLWCPFSNKELQNIDKALSYSAAGCCPSGARALRADRTDGHRMTTAPTSSGDVPSHEILVPVGIGPQPRSPLRHVERPWALWPPTLAPLTLDGDSSQSREAGMHCFLPS